MYRENYRSVIRALVPGESEERNLSWLAGSTVADLSNDGKKLLFYEEGSNANRPDEQVFTTYLRSTDGSDAVKLGEGRALALSPDGEWALVVRPSPAPHLVLLPTGPGEARPLPGAGDIRLYWRASFFPDGRRILVHGRSEDGRMLSYVHDIEGAPPKPFGDGLWAHFMSADGNQIVAEGEKGPGVYSADGKRLLRSIKGAGPDDLFIQWSADGKTIYAIQDDKQQLILYRLDLPTGRRERWKELGPPDRTGFLYFGPAVAGLGTSITPDGRYYAYTYLTDSSRLVLGEGGPDSWK